MLALFAALGPPAGAAEAPAAPPFAADGAEAPQSPARAALPAILSEQDAARYRRIFALQETGDWRAADREIRALGDRLLMGHVRAQRYLHPTKYRSRFAELADWLESYADHPQAPRIYRLALRRKPARAAPPPRPTYKPAPAVDVVPPPADYVSPQRRSPRQAREAARLRREIAALAASGRPEAARSLLDRSHTQRLLDPVEADMAAADIGAAYFFRGDARKALANAAPAAERSGRIDPQGHWIAGLAAFRLGSYARAAAHFEDMARSERSSAWTESAAGFWAARAHLHAEEPARVTRWLERAAAHPTTFYGLLARRVLGQKLDLGWRAPPLEERHIALLAGRKAGKRALALLQVGQSGLAERELRGLAKPRDPERAEALLALAAQTGLPALSLYAAGFADDDDEGRYAALYPLPRWKPEGGYTVDRALVYAFMRQESAFNARAVSRSGARGLMQLMPRTASYIADTRLGGVRRYRLYDPAYNIALGQKYLEHLIGHDAVQGDLLRLAAAYNGGPGNLSRWRRAADGRQIDDTLMFIESIPSRETRIFVERVLANLWIYRIRLGQDTPSLDALAAGRRPVYISLDGKVRAEVDHARN